MVRWTRLALSCSLAVLAICIGIWGIQQANLGVAADDQVSGQQNWVFAHKKLSNTAADSTTADIETFELDNGSKVIVVVWTEGQSDVEQAGAIKMRWKFENAAGTWRMNSSQAFPLAGLGNSYGYPSLALYQDSEGLHAHVVYLHTDGDSRTGVAYKKCTLTETSENCAPTVKLSYDESSAPSIDVDDDGAPHVVWAQDDVIYYNNRSGGEWHGVPWAIQTPKNQPGVSFFKALGKLPQVVAQGRAGQGDGVAGMAGGQVFVAWDRELDGQGEDQVIGDPSYTGYYGIWLAKRDGLDPVANNDDTESAKWQMDRVTSPNDSTFSGGETIHLIDDRPALAVGDNGLYLSWQRLVYRKLINSCYQYQVAYRVFKSPFTDVTQNWWPGGNLDTAWQAPYTATTYILPELQGTPQDLYSGARPSVQVVADPGQLGNDQLHISWQQSSLNTCGSTGGPAVRDAGVSANAESDVEGIPSRVYHAYASHHPNFSTVSTWVSQLITIQQQTYGFFANPNLSMLPGDVHTDSNKLHPHVALLDRFPIEDPIANPATTYAWDVWYANDEMFFIDPDPDPFVYLPVILNDYH